MPLLGPNQERISSKFMLFLKVLEVLPALLVPPPPLPLSFEAADALLAAAAETLRFPPAPPPQVEQPPGPQPAAPGCAWRGAGMVTIKFESELPSFKEDLNQVSSDFLLMTSTMVLANKGLYELTWRPLLTGAVLL